VDVRLGEVHELDGVRWICTFVSGSVCTPKFCVWTAIPDGDDESGLGRRYRAAAVQIEPPEATGRFEKSPV
jgi:hypothetical protein